MIGAGSTLGSYRLVSELGRGGNAQVWRAEGADGATVAVKVLTRMRGDGPERFRREADRPDERSVRAGEIDGPTALRRHQLLAFDRSVGDAVDELVQPTGVDFPVPYD